MSFGEDIAKIQLKFEMPKIYPIFIVGNTMMAFFFDFLSEKKRMAASEAAF